MIVVTQASELHALHGCIVVPTMGALHDGHLALVRRAVAERASIPSNPPIVVTIFVNPTQFNDPRDLARYPRTLDADAAGCSAAGADVVFAPSVETVYPPGHSIPVPRLPAAATQPGLEDALRPGHFAGVCQVVQRLFDLVRPAAAVFGEKDWQQLQVIRAMVKGSAGGPRIISLPTVREPDGLAMSSRNVFLSPDDRRRAVAISRALRLCAAERTPETAERVMHAELSQAGLAVEYAVVRQAESLLTISASEVGGMQGRALIAARTQSVRLIDNAPWPL